jgi:hypothetical protein
MATFGPRRLAAFRARWRAVSQGRRPETGRYPASERARPVVIEHDRT